MVGLLLASGLPLLIEYIFYFVIIVVGLIILSQMKRKKKKPTAQIAIQKTQEILKKIDGVLSEDKKQTKTAEYVFPVKKMQLYAEVGDLLVLIDREASESRQIEYQEIEGYYRRASDKLYELNAIWDGKEITRLLKETKKELLGALSLLERISDRKK